jgi:phosphonate transport system ATP-binding protein
MRLAKRLFVNSAPAHTSAGVFELNSASAKYDDEPVLQDITLAIAQGERVALVGESGAGKSTLLRLLYERCSRSPALIPQEYGLVKTLSAFHNVYMGRLQRHRTWYNLLNLFTPLPREKRQVKNLLEHLGMGNKILTPVGELSGGQQQRIAVARALYQNAAVLLGDEPVSALDEPASHLVLQTIGEYYDTVVLAMHDVRLALQYTTRVIGVHNGVIAIDAASSDVTPADLTRFYSS